MKLTDDIVKALNKGIEGMGSKSRFARKANVSANTLRKYLNRKTKSVKDETWDKIYPFIKSHLSQKSNKSALYKSGNLTSDEKVLLDAFTELPPEIQQKKLLEIIELAKQAVKKTNQI